MRSFYGAEKRRSYFEGWYFKQQNDTETVAFIPAWHVDSAGRSSASLQVITGGGSYCADFPARAFEADETRLLVRVGASVFSSRGCKLDLQTEGLSVQGMLRYGPLLSPRGDIMGPLCHVPFLPCRHGVFSLRHTVSGTLTLNGTPIVFDNGTGYLEGDRGRSFPRRYLWTQCLFPGGSLMLSAAEFPFPGFTGCVGFVLTGGQEYRIATYRGGTAESVSNRALVLRQGGLMVRAELLGGDAHSLRAPQAGCMTRTIREGAACRVHYVCTQNGRTLLDLISDQAGFEGNWDHA